MQNEAAQIDRRSGLGYGLHGAEAKYDKGCVKEQKIPSRKKRNAQNFI
jgi:hypothetical protein